MNSGIPYTFSSSIGYDKLSLPYKSFCLSVSSTYELQFFHQAVKFQHWCDAMSAEIVVLEENNTWVLIDLPPTKIHIGCKWDYKVKHKADRSIEKYKD